MAETSSELRKVMCAPPCPMPTWPPKAAPIMPKDQTPKRCEHGYAPPEVCPYCGEED